MDVTKPHTFTRFGAMDVTKPYKFIGFGAMDVTKPCKFIGFGSHGSRIVEQTCLNPSETTRGRRPCGRGKSSHPTFISGTLPGHPKPYKFIGFGDIYGPKPYKFIGFGDIDGPKPYKFIGFGASSVFLVY